MALGHLLLSCALLRFFWLAVQYVGWGKQGLFFSAPILAVCLPVAIWWESKFVRLWRRDLRLTWLCFSASLKLAKRSWDRAPLHAIFDGVLRRDPGKVCFWYGDESWTFQDVEDYANQVANYFSTVRNLKKGDCVALFASSCPEYACIWLGLSKIGCITSFINSNIKGDALLHAVDVVSARVVIVSSDLLDVYKKISRQLEAESVHALVLCERKSKINPIMNGIPTLNEGIAEMPKSKPVCSDIKLAFTDKIGYIYTSGTTGLPKPCVITAKRMFTFSVVIKSLSCLTPRDVLYCTLPMYHVSGGIIAVGQALMFGSTVVIRKKFSASSFWSDIARYKCTAFQYIGEMCRYLLKQPVSDSDGQASSLRIMIGQGLRGNIWKEFADRFKISFVLETYGSTEGNVGLANLNGKPGAIGFTSWFLRIFRPQYLITIDGATGLPLRCQRGLCIQAKPGEVGELVGKISWNPFTHFDGYLDKLATEKKILTDVLKSGDRFFRTGDLMTADEEGYISFVDRSGDTFRWRGENVSTTEVENAITNCLRKCDVAVFGVNIPGLEGKAGMACVAGPAESLNEKSIIALNSALKDALPGYARPAFLRIVPDIDITGTFKVTKTRLKEEGYDLSRCSGDRVFYLDRASDSYQSLTPDIHRAILHGEIGTW